MISHSFNGQLILDEEDQSRMNYIVKDILTGENKSITNILDTIYNNKNSVDKLIRVVGRIYNSNHSFTGFSSLLMVKDPSGISGYHIGNFKLDKQLFELVGDKIEMILEDYTDSTQEFIEDNTEDTTQDETIS